MSPLRLLLAIGLMLVQAFAVAHTDLKSSIPADGAMLDTSPAELQLTFSGAVRLAKVELKTSDGKSVALDYQPPAAVTASFAVPLPDLQPGNYTARWTAIGADTHKIEGDIRFMVHGAAGSQPEHAGDSSHDHGH